ATTKLVKQYHLYNQYILVERAKQLKRAGERYANASAELSKLDNMKDELQNSIASLELDLQATEQRLEIAKIEEKQLENHDIFELERTLSEKKAGLIQLEKELT